MSLAIVLFLLGLSALFSGMNLGLMSLDPHELERKIALGDKRASKIYPIRRRGNLLLVTLLMGNVAVISTLSIYLESWTHGLIAAVVTTLLVTIFGEIIPQALFSRFALSLGAKLNWLVNIFIIILWPICAPIAWALDRILGDELPTVYSKKELLKIIEEHRRSHRSEVDTDEQRIVRGALTFSEKQVHDVMTPRSVLVAIESHQQLTNSTIKQLVDEGQSRIPVYDKRIDNIVGILYLRDLIDRKPIQKTAGEMCDKQIFYIHRDDNLDSALNQFIRTHHHLFVVVNDFSEVDGVLSIEDVLETIIRREIVDEFDRYHDMRAVAKKRTRSVKHN